MRTKRFQAILLVALLVMLGFAWTKRYQLQDWWRLRDYTPPSAVAQLADQDTMNDYTRHLFYLNHPKLLATVTQFRQYCPENEDTIVLGCYHTGQNGIFIYAVPDPSLAGIQQVTAAHEVLHSVYARLSSSDRSKLNGELESFYEHGLTDSNVKAEVGLYKKTEPGAVYDEMSCTFGTELATLPPSLEAYYAKYFNNRQKIVQYEAQYRVQFTSRQQQISNYDAQLSTMKSQINSQQSNLTTEASSLDTQKANLDQLLSSGQVSAYNAGVNSYNNQADSYNVGVSALKREISSYNQLVDTRNSIAGQLTTLDSAIDTRVPDTVSP